MAREVQKSSRSGRAAVVVLVSALLAFFLATIGFHDPRAFVTILVMAAVVGFLFLIGFGIERWWNKLPEVSRATLWKLAVAVVLYGGLIAAVFIFWNPPPISDVPLARLTLGAIASNVGKWLIIGCFVVGFLRTLNE